MKKVLLLTVAAGLLANMAVAIGAPVVVSKDGEDMSYVESVGSGADGLSPEMRDAAQRFGTYDDLVKSKTVKSGSVWVGTVVEKDNGQCTERLHRVVSLPTDASGAYIPGKPIMAIDSKPVPCPT